MKKIICFTKDETRDAQKINTIKELFPNSDVMVAVDSIKLDENIIDDSECIILNTDSYYIFDLANKNEDCKVSFWFDNNFNFQLTNFYFQYKVNYFFIHEKNIEDFKRIELPIEFIIIENNEKIGSKSNYNSYELCRKLLKLENTRLRKLQ